MLRNEYFIAWVAIDFYFANIDFVKLKKRKKENRLII
jgi:hypothetical protein